MTIGIFNIFLGVLLIANSFPEKIETDFKKRENHETSTWISI